MRTTFWVSAPVIALGIILAAALAPDGPSASGGYPDHVFLQNTNGEGESWTVKIAVKGDGDFTADLVDPITHETIRQLFDYEAAKLYELQLPGQRVTIGDYNAPVVSARASDAHVWSVDAQYWAALGASVPAGGSRQVSEQVIEVPDGMRLVVGRLRQHAKDTDLRWQVSVGANDVTADDYKGDQADWNVLYDNSEGSAPVEVSVMASLVNVGSSAVAVDNRASMTVFFAIDWDPSIDNNNPAT